MKTLSRIVVLLLAAWAAPRASAAVVINEIHYNPDVKTEAAEFIELYNAGASTVNLGGWAFTDGINYTFPSTNLAPGAFLVVAQNPAVLQAKFGVSRALGPFNPDGSSGLSSRGERLTLRNAAGQIEDEVEYQLGFPWPTVGDSTTPGNGNSIELIHPSLDNNLAGSWRASGSGAGGSPLVNTTLLASGGAWKLVKGTAEASTPATLWRQPGFDDSAWTTATLPVGYGETFLATTLADMNGAYSSVFLRKQITVADPGQFTRLVLESQYDDGFKMWINGTLVVDNTANMTAGEVAFNGTAIASFEQGAFANVNMAGNPLAALVPGVNTIAVQAHNSALAGSSDFFFDARLIGQTGGSGGNGPSPGRINTVFANNAPPQTRQVEHAPNEPVSGQAVRISAKVTDPDGVASVTLQYQIVSPGAYIELADPAYTNAANWISLPMNDSGTAGDVTAGDDVYSAVIPASVQTHRRLIRYRLTAADTSGASVRLPYADDPQPNFAYFVYDGVPGWSGAIQPGAAGANGVVQTFSSNTMGRLPAFHLIGKSNTIATATWFSRYTGDLYQWGGALVYDGKVYDHIRYRARGGVWRYSMAKNMWKFDLNRGHDLEMRDNWGRRYSVPWTKLNLGASIQQGDFNHRGEQGMFESVGFRLFNLAGVAAPHSTFCTFRVIDEAQEASPATQYEGDFWGVYLAIEQENGRFLDEHGLPDGNLYKMEGGTGELNNVGPSGPTDKSDLNYLQANYNNASEAWWRTNWNLMRHYSYQAIVQGIHHYDIADGKNYFFYRNPETRLWETCTWDLDLTWANNMYRSGQTGGDEPLKSRLLDNFNNPGRLPNINIEFRNRVREIRDLLWNNDQAYALIDEYANLLRGPTNGPTLLDADRMMWDYNPKMISSTYSENPASKAGQGRYYNWPVQAPNPANLPKTFAGGLQLMKSYVDYRATNTTFSLDTIATDNARPTRPTATDISLAGHPINQLKFRSSTYSGAGAFQSMRWRVGEITDKTSPNYNPSEPHKYEIETVWDSGPITSFNADITIPADVLRVGARYRARVLHTDVTGRNSNWSLPVEFTCGGPFNEADLLNHLRITELMYNPPSGGYEYVELYNSSTTATLDLSGVKFTQGIDFTFPQGTSLPPAAYLVLVGTADIAGFRAYYGLNGGETVIGSYSGSLNNAGEQLVLRTSAGGTDIVSFNYSDGRGWPAQADGTGHALVLLDSALAAQGGGADEYAGNWRASSYLRGSPGRADALIPARIVLNEIVANTPELNDWIELYNPTDAAITLGAGWYLSDDGGAYTNLMKWQIPPGTTIPAHGFVSFDENTGFHNPTNTGFALSKGGDEVFLSFLPGNAQDRVVDAVSFKAQEETWSLGRYPDGGAFWYALSSQTRGTTNAPPPHRAMISELMYHPQDILVGTNLTDNSLDEFIEIASSAGSGRVTMTNAFNALSWRLSGGVEFTFPPLMALDAPERILIVNFDPTTNATQLAAFKQRYGITNPDQRVLGPYLGKLANNSDRIALERPVSSDIPGQINWVIVDEVLYADQSPWPCGTDGTGNSLQRVNALQYGSDPANWSAEPPTAGRERENLPPGLPAITAQPQDRVVATNAAASFSVSVCGTPPFAYQWKFGGAPIPNATNSTFTIPSAEQSDAGKYSVTVSNPAGSVTSDAATLIVQFPPFILAHPQPVTAIRDQTAAFSVVAGGTAPLGYQWRLNGVNLPDRTNDTLILSPVRTNDAGNYSVVVFNTAGSVPSANASLTVLVPATVTGQPASRTNKLTLASVSPVIYNPTNATFNVTAVGIGTLRYQWKRNGTALPGANSSTLVLSNLTPADAGHYTVQVVDDIGPTESQPATLTILVDPVFVVNPANVSGPAGSAVTLSVGIVGHPPPFGYEWRRGTVVIASNTSLETMSFFTTNLFAVSGANASTGQYRVVVRNVSKPTGTASAFGSLLLATDADGDGLDDDWEARHFASSTAANPADDTDGDGLTNAQEFIAGTDPTDASSYLKVGPLNVERSALNAQRSVQIEFHAVSNRTYTVLFSPEASGSPWTRVADVLATPTNRSVTVLDSRAAQATPGFYRLVTPKAP